MDETSPRSYASCTRDREYLRLRSDEDRAKYLALHSNGSLRQIGKEFGLSKSSVDRYRRLARSGSEIRPQGGKTLLPHSMELQLIKKINSKKDEGYAFRVDEFLREANLLAESCQAPELDHEWFLRFLKRYPELKTGFVCEVDAARLEKCTTDVILQFFVKYIDELMRMQDFPMLFWNADETRMYRTPNGRLCVIPRDEFDLVVEKQTTATFKTSGEMAINGMGMATTPLFTLPTLNILNELLPSPAFPYEVAFIHSKSSWFKTHHFEAWFTEIFVPEAIKVRSDFALESNEHTIVLFVDNATIHNKDDLKPWTDFYNIRIIEIPPKYTHVLQALDGPPFSVFKKQIRKFDPVMPPLNTPLLNKVAADRLRHFRAVLRAYSIAFIPHNIVSTFSRIGFLPLDPSKPLCSTLINPRLEKDDVEEFLTPMFAKMDMAENVLGFYRVESGKGNNVEDHCVSTYYGVLKAAELPRADDTVSPSRKRADTI